MYNDDSYIGITFFAYLGNPVAIATKKFLPLATCIQKTYMKGGHV
jgi:hypothetical protein